MKTSFESSDIPTTQRRGVKRIAALLHGRTDATCAGDVCFVESEKERTRFHLINIISSYSDLHDLVEGTAYNGGRRPRESRDTWCPGICVDSLTSSKLEIVRWRHRSHVQGQDFRNDVQVFLRSGKALDATLKFIGDAGLIEEMLNLFRWCWWWCRYGLSELGELIVDDALVTSLLDVVDTKGVPRWWPGIEKNGVMIDFYNSSQKGCWRVILVFR